MQSLYKTNHYTALILFLLMLSIVIRTILWSLLGSTPQMSPDSMSYIMPAQSLLETGAFLSGNGTPETVRTPGFPLLIATTYFMHIGLTGLIVIQHMLTIIIAALIGWLLSQKDEGKSALLATGLTGFNFLLTYYANFILSEILFSFMATIGIILLALAPKSGSKLFPLISAGAMILGCSALIRPIALFAFIPATIYLVTCLPKKRIRHALIFTIIFSMAPGLWMIRNHQYIDQYSLSSISDINILGYQAAGTLAMKEGGDYATNHERIKQELYATAQKESLQKKSPLNSIYRDMGIRIIRDNPLHFLKHMARNTTATLMGNASTAISRVTGVSLNTAHFLGLLYTIPALALSLHGMGICWRRQRHLATLSFLFIGYFVGIAAAGGVGGSRFRIPVEPIFCMLIAMGITDLFHRFKRN